MSRAHDLLKDSRVFLDGPGQSDISELSWEGWKSGLRGLAHDTGEYIQKKGTDIGPHLGIEASRHYQKLMQLRPEPKTAFGRGRSAGHIDVHNTATDVTHNLAHHAWDVYRDPAGYARGVAHSARHAAEYGAGYLHGALGHHGRVGAGIAMGGALAYQGMKAFTKHHIRTKYGLHGHVKDYHRINKAISLDRSLTKRGKANARAENYHTTLTNMAAHVTGQTGAPYHHAMTAARQALHGHS